MAESFPSSPEAPLGRGNNDDRRQWRKQGVIVGAAASKTRVLIKAQSGCWGPQPGLVERSETERLFQNDPPDEPPKPSESVDEPPEELDSFLGGS